MKNISKKELKKIINSGEFNKLIGISENDFFECKRNPYSLKHEAAKRELAKDISSFANSEGGYIFIGPHTKKSETHHSDMIIKIGYLTEDSLNTQQYKNIIKEWIYPEINGLTILWVRNKSLPDKGIFIINIPKQDMTLKPFLITKYIEGRKKTEILMGYSERKMDTNEPKDIRIIHTFIRDGMNFNKNIAFRFDNIDSILEISKKNEEMSRNKNFEQDIEERVIETLAVNDMNKHRLIFLAAYPKNPNLLETIFEKKKGSILKKLENPGGLRHAGWDLETLDFAEIFERKYIQVSSKQKTIRLFQDGTLIFAANQNFWAWPDRDGQKLNCLGIIEGIYNFVSFYKNVFEDFSYKEDTIAVKFGFKNLLLDRKPSFLCGGSLNSTSYRFPLDPKKAPKDSYTSEPLEFNIKKINERSIAYSIAKEVYLWFGITSDYIPYTKEDEKGTVIVDTEAIKNVR